MAYDRFITWPDNSQRPSPEEVEKALRRYIHLGGTVSKRDGSWLDAVLPGEPRYVFKDWADEEALKRGGNKGGERWFEVFVPTNLTSTYSIITRTADEFTNAVADGFASLVARRWDGKWDREL